MTEPLYVTRPSLPPLEELQPYLERIWASHTLTNGGPLHQELEAALCDYLGVPYISLFNNGTIALMTALQVMGLRGEVITTPFTFVATANAIVWNGLTPVFADVDPDSLNLDPSSVEACISERTAAILPVHCYGAPCAVEELAQLGHRHGLPVIYDAAHAFGVQQHKRSLLQHGDLAVLSFHATKVFNTFEGGAIVSHSAEMKARIDRLKNFGYVSEEEVSEPGLNGKMSELNAAVGLVQLRHVDAAIAARGQVDAQYREALAAIPGLDPQPLPAVSRHNYSYFPLRVRPAFGLSRDALDAALKRRGIFGRRYFHPLLTEFSAHAGAAAAALPHAQSAGAEVFCLPIHGGMRAEDIQRVIDALHDIQRSGA